jgi:hypothetical protein
MRALVLIGCLLALGAPAARAQQNAPVVVELYTAQGCEDCPRADAVLAELSKRGDIVALTFPVDYWDYLGWKDTQAHPAFTARQKAYKAAFRLRELRTPQVVVAGAAYAPGFDAGQVLALVRAHREPRPDSPVVQLGPQRNWVLVKDGRDPPGGGAEVWMIRYDPRVTRVAITKGDNKGNVASHRNVVRELVRLGPWTGRGRIYALPRPTREGLRTVVVVQTLRERRILGSAAER